MGIKRAGQTLAKNFGQGSLAIKPARHVGFQTNDFCRVVRGSKAVSQFAQFGAGQLTFPRQIGSEPDHFDLFGGRQLLDFLDDRRRCHEAVFLFGGWRILAAIFTFQKARRPSDPLVWVPKAQVTAWVCLLVGTVIMFSTGHAVIGMIMVVVGIMLPVTRRKRIPKGEEWPTEKSAAASKPTLIEHPSNPNG
jgi:hypothetical protein